jgi:hypothetical protein
MSDSIESLRAEKDADADGLYWRQMAQKDAAEIANDVQQLMCIIEDLMAAWSEKGWLRTDRALWERDADGKYVRHVRPLAASQASAYVAACVRDLVYDALSETALDAQRIAAGEVL